MPHPDLTEAVLIGTIRSRLANRRWYRAHRTWTTFAELERENTIALRALLEVARSARRPRRPRPIPAGEAPGVYVEAYGR